jgi:predicted SAM-dependent methyltransferase
MKLEIGPGKERIGSDWITVGPFDLPHVDVIESWGEKPLSFEDNSVDVIHASHVLEHVIWHKTVEALEEAHRILKTGGKLEIHVPNFEYIAKCFVERKCGDEWRAHNKDGDFMTWVNGRLFTTGEPGNLHMAVFTEESLTSQLKQAGFSSVERGAPIRSNNHGKINLAVTAIK